MRPHLVSQLAHVELLTPKLQESLWFFRELMGMEESGRPGGLRVSASVGTD